MRQQAMQTTSVAAGVLNLVAPGAGLSLIGSHAWGIGSGLAFALGVNGAIASIWLFPDEVPPEYRAFLVGLGATAFFVAQIRLEQELRQRRAASAQAERRAQLALVQDELGGGDPQAAWEALQPLREAAPDDLLIALLSAETLTGLGDQRAAARAWERLAVLDRHHLYRTQIAEGRARLGDLPPDPEMT